MAFDIDHNWGEGVEVNCVLLNNGPAEDAGDGDDEADDVGTYL